MNADLVFAGKEIFVVDRVEDGEVALVGFAVGNSLGQAHDGTRVRGGGPLVKARDAFVFLVANLGVEKGGDAERPIGPDLQVGTARVADRDLERTPQRRLRGIVGELNLGLTP